MPTNKSGKSHFQIMREKARKIEEILSAFDLHPEEASKIIVAVECHNEFLEAAKQALDEMPDFDDGGSMAADMLRAVIAKTRGH